MTRSAIDELWGESLIAFNQYLYLLNKLLTEYRGELVPWMKKALLQRPDMPLALLLVEKLNIEEKKLLFPTLVRLASYTVPHTGTARAIVCSLPRDWVLAHIEEETEKILKQAGPEEVRRVLELYSDLDNDLLRKCCEKLRRSDSLEFRELASEFLE